MAPVPSGRNILPAGPTFASDRLIPYFLPLPLFFFRSERPMSDDVRWCLQAIQSREVWLAGALLSTHSYLAASIDTVLMP